MRETVPDLETLVQRAPLRAPELTERRFDGALLPAWGVGQA